MTNEFRVFAALTPDVTVLKHSLSLTNKSNKLERLSLARFFRVIFHVETKGLLNSGKLRVFIPCIHQVRLQKYAKKKHSSLFSSILIEEEKVL